MSVVLSPYFQKNEYKTLFRHKKRQSVYQIQGIAIYMSNNDAYEGDVVHFVQGRVDKETSIEAANNISMPVDFIGAPCCFIVDNSTFKSYSIIRQSYVLTGTVQCSTGLYICYCMPVVCYKSVTDDGVWFRSLYEFFDGRFERYSDA